MKDDTWEHETKGNHKSFCNDEWKQKQKSWTCDYTDIHDGEVIPTTIYVDEREWRPKWLKWTSLFAKTSRGIDIHFSKEVGKNGRIVLDYLPRDQTNAKIKRIIVGLLICHKEKIDFSGITPQEILEKVEEIGRVKGN